MSEKRCSECGCVKFATEFNHSVSAKDGLNWECRQCDRARQARWRKANPDKVAAGKRKDSYGLAQEDYDRLLAGQNGLCAVCEQPEMTVVRGKVIGLAVDHDHLTGAIRGLLCRGCNVGIGNLLDEPSLLRKAAEYLEHSRRPEGDRLCPEILSSFFGGGRRQIDQAAAVATDVDQRDVDWAST